jgi:hypothetical protein
MFGAEGAFADFEPIGPGSISIRNLAREIEKIAPNLKRHSHVRMDGIATALDHQGLID